MIGPVQLILIGYTQANLPRSVKQQIDSLRDNPGIRLLDVYQIDMDRKRILSEGESEGPTPEMGAIIKRLLTAAGAAATLGETALSGTGYLMHGDEIPDLRTHVTAGTHVVALLIEHRWANPLWNAVRKSTAFPITDGWMGREALQKAGLATNESESRSGVSGEAVV
ncbi:hypothetical protein O7622_22595 [Micromonospora sp. WMMD1076]|uniref:hypothetical protein n=1 Tax=Micromonospora TaxID=1873 RepID=UPI00249C2AF6|nr:hypothetical protein [Micromonospora sp. WMMD1076]WFF05835.1 hypothetical protein O7622_22595 [Micromonospora sp. WMMD1076]